MSANCTICNAGNSTTCANCKSSFYCSLECQQTDWPIHKLLCQPMKDLSDRPGPSFKLAILFRPDQINPRLIWVNCRNCISTIGREYETAETSHFLGSDRSPLYIPISWSISRSFHLDRPIQVICRETHLIDGSKTNLSVLQVTRGVTGQDWKGPIVALGPLVELYEPESWVHSLVYEDITLSDFRYAVDYFSSYGKPVHHSQNLAIPDDSKLVGIKITCLGDRKVLDSNPYVAVRVPRDHPVFWSSKPSDVSKFVEFPTLAWKYSPDEAWKDSDDVHKYQNLGASFSHLDTDPQSDYWVWKMIPERQNYNGSMLVVREDKKDLTPYQVEAFCYFCEFRMQELFVNSNEGDRLEGQRVGWIRKEDMNKNSFATFFEEYKAVRAKEDSSWAMAESPYTNM